MAKQILKVGQHIWWRKPGLDSAFKSKRGSWNGWPGIVTKIKDGKAWIAGQYKSWQHLEVTTGYGPLDNHRSIIRPADTNHPNLEVAIEKKRQEIVEKEQAREEYKHKQEVDLARGWATLLAALSVRGTDRRALLEPLIDTHALRLLMPG